MRIRNRKVPLPLSLLSPVPLSDPHLFSRSPVILVQPDSTLHNTPSSSNHLPTSDPLSRHNTTTTTTTTGFQVVDHGVQINNNDDISYANLPPPLPPRSATEYNDNNNNEDKVVGRWCDGDKAIPLKKRRGIGFVENPSTTIINDKEKTTTTMLKLNNTNTEEKKGDNNDVVAVAVAGAGAAVVGKKGNGKRGNTIMEGSRCSRVNGRGWRCCQPTLVGYSLCEHHLGKGRLRSMTSSGSAKSRSSKKKNSNTNNGTKLSLGRVEETQDNMNEKKLERMSSSFGNSKRVKLGVVKARSLSSLLGQTNSMSMNMNNNGFVADHANLQHHEAVASPEFPKREFEIFKSS